MKERRIITGLLTTGLVAAYAGIVHSELKTRQLPPHASYSTRLDYAQSQIQAASDDLDNVQDHATIFGYYLSVGKLDPQDALQRVQNADLALPASSMAKIDLSIAEDEFKSDLHPIPTPIPLYHSSYSYPDHPWDSERMWLGVAKDDLAYDRAKGGK